LSQAIVVPTTVAATAEPNAVIAGHCQCHGYLRLLCRRNCIRCSLRRRPHHTAAFTAIVDATVTAATATSLTQFPSTQSSQAIAITATTEVVAAIAIAFAAAIAAAIALASAVTIAAASTNLSATVIIVNVVIVVVVVVVVIIVVVIAVVASDITAAYAATIALASAVAAATALTAVAVFALRCPAPCASLFWLIVVFTYPLASSHRHHQPDLLSL